MYYVHMSRKESPSLVLIVFLTNTSLHSWSFSNAINPLQEMWERFHLFLGEASLLPSLDPRPCLHVGNRILALAETGEVIAWLTTVLAREMDLENSVYTENFVLETFDGICKMLVTSRALTKV